MFIVTHSSETSIHNCNCKKKKKNLGLIATKEPLSLLLRGRGTLILKLFASSLFFNYVYFFYCVLMLSIFT